VKRRQQGLTLIELLVAMALTALLGVMLAALVNGWVQVRERLSTGASAPGVLEWCLTLERRFDSLVLRELYEKRQPLPLQWFDWQPAQPRLQWVAVSAWPSAEQPSRLQRQRLAYDKSRQRLELWVSPDLYSAADPQWTLHTYLPDVAKVVFSFRQGMRWLAYPSTVVVQPDRGVRLEFERKGSPYVCTFALPDGRI
jgi:general secretion pathway protein J